jgi:hypothetical protein
LFSKSVERTLPAWGSDSVASTGVGKFGSEPQRGTIDLARLFDPGWRESVDAQQVMRHPETWIFERIFVEGNRLALEGKFSNAPASIASRIFLSAMLSHWSTVFFSVTWLPALTLGASNAAPRVSKGTGDLVAAAGSGCFCA